MSVFVVVFIVTVCVFPVDFWWWWVGCSFFCFQFWWLWFWGVVQIAEEDLNFI